MVGRDVSRGRISRESTTSGEDAVMVLGLLVTAGFAITIATLLLLELLQALPPMLSFVVFVSIVVALVMLGRAVAEKVESLPHRPRGGVPVLRNLVR